MPVPRARAPAPRSFTGLQLFRRQSGQYPHVHYNHVSTNSKLDAEATGCCRMPRSKGAVSLIVWLRRRFVLFFPRELQCALASSRGWNLCREMHEEKRFGSLNHTHSHYVMMQFGIVVHLSCAHLTQNGRHAGKVVSHETLAATGLRPKSVGPRVFGPARGS